MSMTKQAIWGEAWVSLGANKMRSFLTMLGIIIGVASVVLMLSIGQGVQNKIEDSISSMGSNLFIVLAGSANTGGVRVGSGSAPTLKTSDAKEIAALNGVVAAAPALPGNAQVIYNASNWSTQVTGITQDYFMVRDWRLLSGSNINDADLRAANRVAILGTTVVESLFPNPEEAIGSIIRIKNIPFEVVGILESKGQSLEGRDQDDAVFIPLTTAQRKLFGNQFPDSVRTIMVKAESEKVMERLETEMRDTLREAHHLGERSEDDFNIRNLTAIAETAQTMGETLSLLLGSIASISLLVGGIGIMNIMLVSVTERTREIGIRKAIGAYESDILLQFLLEAVMISVTGGIVGMLLGIAGSFIATWTLKLQTEVSVISIIMSFVVAAAVGIFFGYYPAKKAARLKPIDALRFQ